MKRLLIILPLIYQLQGCNSAKAESPELQMESEVIHEAEYNEFANITSKSVIVIRSQEEYESELLKRTSEPVEAIDFASESIILIDMGMQTSGGHSLNFSFYEDSNDIQGEIVYSFPSGTCATSTAITNPYKFIKLKSTKFILVSEQQTYFEC
ncbi:protease complex subunit PrcB family protein [Colwellia echini]|uniref:PrcB C-terminal domain-containing protein n=1 Tax=Colwellia echini TaxID=1982103 RepID=A0ABY3MUH0_9GAMM|nr:protease complex subunit PrcB family protein [Colwellia echini]TYK64861.1 hypothetical protein CWS31_013680 [Colwellia echini]